MLAFRCVGRGRDLVIRDRLGNRIGPNAVLKLDECIRGETDGDAGQLHPRDIVLRQRIFRCHATGQRKRGHQRAKRANPSIVPNATPKNPAATPHGSPSKIGSVAEIVYLQLKNGAID